MNGAMIISFGSPARGREAEAVELLHRTMSFHDRLVKSKGNNIDGFMPYLHTSRMGGLMVVNGEMGALIGLHSQAECQELMRESYALVDNVQVQFAAGGSSGELKEPLDMFASTLTKLRVQ